MLASILAGVICIMLQGLVAKGESLAGYVHHNDFLIYLLSTLYMTTIL